MNRSLSDLILSYWHRTGKVKTTPSGWISGNAPCCVHRGEAADTRSRGGLKIGSDKSVTFNCFNCKYHASWKPGRVLSEKMKEFLKWLGVPNEEIKQTAFWIWLQKENVVSEKTATKTIWYPNFETKELPEGARSFAWWAENAPDNKNFNDAMRYLIQRDPKLLDKYEYYFSDEPNTYDKPAPAHRSVIIPFYYQGQIVGWSARKIDKSKQRYMSDTPLNYLFNADVLSRKRKFILLVEGVFDAINLDCIGVLGSTLSREQIDWINAVDVPKIVVPDRNKAGKNLIDVAIKQGWGVSMPMNSGPHKVWDSDITDVSDAVARYGLLYTMRTIMDTIMVDPLEIEVRKRFI